jgi:energy-coupling factor transport system substrate-specific component
MSKTSSAPKKARSSGAKIPTTLLVTVIPVTVALNIVGGIIASALRLPVYLDMIGTAVAAIVLGPWWGALVGLLTNSGSALISGPTSLPFALVNIVGALIWGYGVRSWGLGKSIPKFFLLNVIVAIACTLVAAPIIVLVFGGATGAGADALTAIGQGVVGSVLSSNILTSLADKIIGGFVALAIIEALPKAMTENVPLVKSTPLKGILWAVGGILVGVLVIVVFLALGAGG